MAYTSLAEVWQADVDGTDGRVQADGCWLGSFATEPELPVENIILTPGYEATGYTAAVTDNRQVNPDLNVPNRFGEGINPDYSPGAWIDMRNAWLPITSNNQILDRGTWPMPNIGVASPYPVRWFGLTDGQAVEATSADNPLLKLKEYTAPMGRSGEVIQIGNIIFSATGSRPQIGGPTTFITGDLYVFRHTNSLTDIDRKGVMFLHLSVEQATLTFGVIGETYFQPAALSTLDFFRGNALEFAFDSYETDDEGNRTPVSYTFDLDEDNNPSIPIFGGTADRSVFQVLPVRASIEQTRFFDRFASGFYWQRQIARIGGTEDEPEYQDFVNALDDHSETGFVVGTLRWVEIGGVGRDVLP